MAEVLLFHHAQGLTPGCVSFADRLRAAGHVVHTPDLYDGKTFAELTDGVRYAEEVGFGTIADRGRLAAESVPAGVVYAGFSLGAMPAQMLAQTRPARRARCCSTPRFQLRSSAGRGRTACRSRSTRWRDDEWGDVDVAHGLAEEIETAELFLYPGDRHLFADESLPDYDEDAAALLMERVLRFLA